MWQQLASPAPPKSTAHVSLQSPKEQQSPSRAPCCCYAEGAGECGVLLPHSSDVKGAQQAAVGRNLCCLLVGAERQGCRRCSSSSERKQEGRGCSEQPLVGGACSTCCCHVGLTCAPQHPPAAHAFISLRKKTQPSSPVWTAFYPDIAPKPQNPLNPSTPQPPQKNIPVLVPPHPPVAPLWPSP